MKKWLASFMALSLILAACGQTDDDETKKNDSSSSKTEQHTSNDHSKTNDSKDKKTNEKATSQEDENQATSDSSGHQETTQSNSSSPQSTQDNQNMNRTEQHQSDSNSNASNQENTQQGQSYVAPYHGQNVVPVAQKLAQNPVNQQQALKQLPNFQTSLDVAQKEVTTLNGQQNPYNDYAIQGEGGTYHYIFSFLNQSQPGTYMIVTVDQSGNPRIIDPAYRQ
ncbi:hypothetical protein [Staphylococcus chromogenes]|uniref:hypothetical protein n=1 Tax=Staphylococcus chromogenes TaxID=46126 RepID=UPI002DBE1104|nr:hypothetical protein [Staphylococcus chromogenes]MEB7825006.1 hypothetical protein [Staphylococcus chromogenes]